jgi:hypothetical protein
LANAKFIPSILPDYILPLASALSHDSASRDFEYTFITTYLLKGIHEVGPQLGQIMTLKISDFNLGDRKNYGMIAPQLFDQDKGEEVEDHPPAVDYGYREVHYPERDEDTTLWKASGG